jgi:hypothetical protein
MIRRMEGRDGSAGASRAGAWIAISLGAVIVLAALGSRGVRVHDIAPGVIYSENGRAPAAIARIAQDHRIRTVIDVGAIPDIAPERRRARSAKALRLVRHPIDPRDLDDPEEFADALRVLSDPDARPVLVAGRSDEAMLLLALHLVVVEGATAEEAIARIASTGLRRKRAEPIRDRLRVLSGPVAATLGRPEATSPRLDP